MCVQLLTHGMSLLNALSSQHAPFKAYNNSRQRGWVVEDSVPRDKGVFNELQLYI